MNCPVWPCARKESRRTTDRSEEALDDCASGHGDNRPACSNGLGEMRCPADLGAGNPDSGTPRRDYMAGG